MTIFAALLAGIGLLALGLGLALLIDAALAYMKQAWDRVSIRLVQGFGYALLGVVLLAVAGTIWLIGLWTG